MIVSSYVILIIFATLFYGILLLFVFLSLPKRNKFNFKGKHAFITGGSSDIGKQIAFELLRRGCSISIGARDPKKLETVREELDSYAKCVNRKAKVLGYMLDVTQSYSTVESVIREAERHGGDIDILINSAGTFVKGEFDEMTIYQFEEQVLFNYLAIVYSTKAVLGKMKERRSGHIGIVASIGSLAPGWGHTAYCASSYAVRGFAESLMMELIPYNIGVSLSYPPATNIEGYQAKVDSWPEEMRQYNEEIGCIKPKKVAREYVDDIENGNCSTSYGTVGQMLGYVAAATSEETNFQRALVQVLFGGILRGVTLIQLGKLNKLILKCRQAETEKAPDQ